MQLRISLPFLLLLTFSQEFQSEAGTGWYGSGSSKNRLGIEKGEWQYKESLFFISYVVNAIHFIKYTCWVHAVCQVLC